MRDRRKRRISRRSLVFVVLLFLSLAALIAPPRYTGWLANLVQVVAPFQAVTNRTLAAAEDAFVGPPAPEVKPPDAGELERQRSDLENLLHSLTARMEVLERQNEELTAIRKLGLDTRGDLIPAHVSSQDLLSWRSSVAVDAGSRRKVRTGAAVLSDHFSVNVGSQQGVQDGLRVLSSEALVGTVVNTGTHTARVQLLTDPDTIMVATISRVRDGKPLPLDREFLLQGTGKGRLEIRDVAQKYVLSGDIQTGDVVMTSGAEVILPAPVVVGRVSTIRRDPENGTLYILDVEPAVQPEQLRRVYIVQTGKTGPS